LNNTDISNMSPVPNEGEPPSDPGLALHEQFHSAMAQRAADASGDGLQGDGPFRRRVGAVGSHGRQRPPHHLIGLPPKHATAKQHGIPDGSSSSANQVKKLFPPAVLPIRRPDLLPPILSPVDSPEPTSMGIAAPSSPAPTPVQDFVVLQREKDAPHFKSGKAGGSSSSSHNRKDALQLIAEQEEVIRLRRPTKIIVPAADDHAAEDLLARSGSNPIAPPRGK
jgi:hypothetical protein